MTDLLALLICASPLLVFVAIFAVVYRAIAPREVRPVDARVVHVWLVAPPTGRAGGRGRRRRHVAGSRVARRALRWLRLAGRVLIC